MKDKLPEYNKNKPEKIFLFFTKNDKKQDNSTMNEIRSFFNSLIWLVGLGVIIYFFWIAFLLVINSIPESNESIKERQQTVAKIDLENNIISKEVIEIKFKNFEILLTQTNKSQTEVINFLNQQQNDYLKFSFNPISKNILELKSQNYTKTNNKYSVSDYARDYLMEFEDNKLKYITIKNAEPFDVKYFKAKNIKYSILEPTNQVSSDYYSPIRHLRVELNN